MKFLLSVFGALFLFSFMNSCGNGRNEVLADSLNNHDSHSNHVGMPSFPQTQNIEAKTYPVLDNSGKEKGWGYDLYVDGKRTIHQEIFPGLPGNNSFKTEEDARKMGQLAADRMKLTGTFPTIVPKDFDSLGTTLPDDLKHIIDSILKNEKKPHEK